MATIFYCITEEKSTRLRDYQKNQYYKLVNLTNIYDKSSLRLTKTAGDTTHEYFYNNEVLDMEVVKKNGEVIQYSSYEWDGYTPLGMIVQEKDTAGNYQTKAKKLKYNVMTNNCMQVSTDVILKSKSLTKYQRNSLKYWVKNIVVPNDVRGNVASLFGNSKYKR